jgi:hypothetical protein
MFLGMDRTCHGIPKTCFHVYSIFDGPQEINETHAIFNLLGRTGPSLSKLLLVSSHTYNFGFCLGFELSCSSSHAQHSHRDFLSLCKSWIFICEVHSTTFKRRTDKNRNTAPKVAGQGTDQEARTKYENLSISYDTRGSAVIHQGSVE